MSQSEKECGNLGGNPPNFVINNGPVFYLIFLASAQYVNILVKIRRSEDIDKNGVLRQFAFFRGFIIAMRPKNTIYRKSARGKLLGALGNCIVF